MAQASFKFESDAGSGGDQFTVVSFKGEEAISTIYRYEIELKAPTSASIILDDILDSSVKFITEIGGQKYPVHGILSSLNEKQTVQGYVYYDAILVPRLWYLSTYQNNDIYSVASSTIKSIIDNVLSNSLLGSSDYDLSGIDDSRLLERDYVCQFGESDFDFISRLIENEGIFYYFEQDGGVERIVFIDDSNYDGIPGRKKVKFGDEGVGNRIYAWSCRKQRLPYEVRLRDYNHEQVSDNISSTIAIDPMGQGTDYYYGDNVTDSNEVAYLCQIRAEESLCRQTRYYGESNVSRMRAGYQFKLDYAANPSYDNSRYLLTEVSSEGQYLDMVATGDAGATPQYRNSFVAIDSVKQFRPARVTPKPRFYGTMTAFIHADQATNNIEINQQGYYRVSLPFDQSSGPVNDRTDTTRKLSTWIRMAQPYAGTDEGLYYPLKGGTEVLLTFINGDPDRPIISAALPNAIAPSLLTSANSTESILQTRGPLIEQIGITGTTKLPLPVFSQLVVDKTDDVIKDKCDVPTLHPDTNPPTRGVHIDGHTNIQSKGSFVIHAQTQCEDESAKLTASHNNAFAAPTNDTFIKANPAKIKNPAVDLKKIKFEMLEDRVILDAGNRDLLIKCNHFDVENVSEINDTVGHDHSTHHGSAYNEFYGESEEHYHGTKSESFNGMAGLNGGRGKLTGKTTDTDIEETFKDCNITEKFTDCDITETFTGGHTSSSYTGTATEQYYGNKFEFTFSSVEAINLGHSFEFFGGLKEEISVINSLDVFLGAQEEFMFGFQTGITMAGFLKYTGGFGIDKTSARLDDTDAKIDSVKADIKKANAQIQKAEMNIAKNALCLLAADLLII